MIPLEVHTRLNREGEVIPLTCMLEGRKIPVTGIGRRWQAEDGEHIMAMLPRDRAVELLRRPDGSWFLVKDHSALGDRLA
jgi:hypothetical protein